MGAEMGGRERPRKNAILGATVAFSPGLERVHPKGTRACSDILLLAPLPQSPLPRSRLKPISMAMAETNLE